MVLLSVLEDVREGHDDGVDDLVVEEGAVESTVHAIVDVV
jgi:hypothetical protein